LNRENPSKAEHEEHEEGTKDTKKGFGPDTAEPGNFCRSLLAGEWLRRSAFVRLQAGSYKVPILTLTGFDNLRESA